jgi:hypothetical protein
MWANIFQEKCMHVVPCNYQGIPLNPHTPSTECLCHPTVTLEYDADGVPYILVVHNQLH